MADVEGFEWVSEEQESRLRSWSGEWPAQLRQQLDEQWPGWEQAGDDDRRQWLDDFAAALETETTPDVSHLEWVTAEHQTQLDELWEVRGDWRHWLPGELDSRWADWRHSTADVLGPWLDQLIPSLVLPSELDDAVLADIVHGVVAPTVDSLYDNAEHFAAELGISVADYLAELAELPPEELTEAILTGASQES